jgi:hypothetical protein
MNEPTPLITMTQTLRVGDFKVEPDGVMVLPGVELFTPGNRKSHEDDTKIDEGELTISKTSVAFTGRSNAISFPLTDVTRVQPYDTSIDIYERGRKEPYKFAWGERISMKLVGLFFDDGKVKPLEGRMVAQFIINEKNRIGNLRKAK